MSWTVCSTPYIPKDTTKIDSAKQLKVHVWRLNRMLNEVQAGRICDSLQRQQQRQLVKAEELQKKTEEALIISKEQTCVAKQEANTWSKKYDAQTALLENKDQDRRRFRRERNISVLINIGLLLLLIL